jgi:hypothetical protein
LPDRTLSSHQKRLGVFGMLRFRELQSDVKGAICVGIYM